MYELTKAGREELRRWLDQGVEVMETRDEASAEAVLRRRRIPTVPTQILAAKRRLHEEKLEALHMVEAKTLAIAAADDPFPYLVLRFGVESSQWMIDWCDRARAELADAAEEGPRRRA